MSKELEHAWDGRDSEDDNQPLSVKKAQLRLQEQRRLAHRGKQDTLSSRVSGTHTGSAPLVEQVTNRWKTDEKYSAADTFATPHDGFEPDLHCCDLDDSGSCPNLTLAASRSARVRKMILLWLGVFLALYAGWKYVLHPRWKVDMAYLEGFSPDRLHGTYGIARGGSFDGTRVQDLDAAFIPGGQSDHKGHRRLVFVGDVHGCLDELKALLKKVDFNPDKDHLIATGDVVSKGPNSRGVLDELLRLNASCVRGNHEDRLLGAAKTILGEDGRVLPRADNVGSKGAAKDVKLIKQLGKEHLKYLHNMPLILRIPPLPAATLPWSRIFKRKPEHIKDGLLVVHAGLVPSVALKKQDPYFVMNMRSINRRTHVPSTTHDSGAPWYNVWNWYQGRLASHGNPLADTSLKHETKPTSSHVGKTWRGAVIDAIRDAQDHASLQPHVVVYGHDSKAGLQDHRWSKGLDTRCVNGGKLTAMILDATGRMQLVSVKCSNHRS